MLRTDADFARRRAELQANLKNAEQAYGAATLAAANGSGTDDDQRDAKAEVDRLNDQLAAIEAAWTEKQRAEKQARREAEVAAWEETRAKIDSIAEEAETFSAGIADLRQQAQAFVSRYSDDYGRISNLLRQHKAPPRRGISHGLFNFNVQRDAKLQKAGAVLGALSTLQELFVQLGGDAGAAAAELRPAEEYA